MKITFLLGPSLLWLACAHATTAAADATSANAAALAVPAPTTPANSDAPPDSEVFIANLDIARRKVGQPRNISQHPGYDNQPAFLHSGKALLFVSDRSGSTDVYRYELRSGVVTQVTHTAEGEFSPTPLADDRGFSVVRVAEPGPQGADATHPPVWRYDMTGKPDRPVVDVLSVGYHAWMDADHLALFVVGDPAKKEDNRLVYVDIKTGDSSLLSTAPGRQLGRTPDGKRVSFLDKSDPAHWRVVARASGDAAPIFLVDTPQVPGEKDADRSEDYCWLPDGSLMMAHGNTLLRWNGKRGAALEAFAEVANVNGDIKRLAVSPDGRQLAFVVQPRDKSISGTPRFGRWGYALDNADTATRPGDDFFRHVNGGWIDRTEIPADKPIFSLRLMMTDTTDQRLHELLETAAAKLPAAGLDPATATIEQKTGAFYKAFMDEPRINALGVAAIKPQLDAVRSATSRAQLAALMGRNNADFYGTLFNAGIDVDLKDPKSYAVYLGQSGLGLPDRDYYLNDSFAPQRAAHLEHMTRLLGLVGWPNPQTNAKSVLAYETEVARASWTRVQQRDVLAAYNPMSIAQLRQLAPGFAWDPFLRAAGLQSTTRVIVDEKSAFPKLAALYASAPIDTLKAWQAVNIADAAAIYLPQPFQDAHFDFHNHALSGQPTPEARWKRGVRAVSGGDFLVGDRVSSFGNIGWAVGQLYTDRYFPPQSKAAIEALVVNLRSAFRARLEKLDWMGPDTRREALRKLDTYTIKVGYPDHARDYSHVLIRDDDLVGDVLRAADANWQFYVARLGGPVDRGDWAMTPQTNDAYNGSLRDIVFPAGILQAPIFDANADPAINYGAAGGIIGHELIHGFDDQGRRIDADGALRDWWSAADAQAFDARAKLLGAQYSAFEPLPGVHVNGDLTMGENIADLGGLTLALDAYRASLHGQPAPVLDGMTGEQRVFLGWAQAWCGKLRDDAMRRQVASDPHSPRMYRVNGVVRNIDDWYELFGVKPGDALYLPPEKRVRLW